MTIIVSPSDSTREVFQHDDFRRFCAGEHPAHMGAQSTTDAAGGFTVGEAGQGIVDFHLGQASVMRRVCGVSRVSTGEPIPFAAQSSAAAVNASSVTQNAAIAAAADVTFRGGGLDFDTWSTKELVVSRELLEDSSVDLEREIVQVLTGWMAPELDKAYTRGAGSTIIQGVEEGTALKDFHASNTLAAADPLELLETLLKALPRNERSGAIFMASTGSLLRLVRSLATAYPGAFPATVSDDDERRIRLGLSTAWANDDLMADDLTLAANAEALATLPAKSLLYGNLAAHYRIFDAGEALIERFEDSTYTKKRQVGFVLVMRTAGRLIGPDRAVIYGS